MLQTKSSRESFTDLGEGWLPDLRSPWTLTLPPNKFKSSLVGVIQSLNRIDIDRTCMDMYHIKCCMPDFFHHQYHLHSKPSPAATSSGLLQVLEALVKLFQERRVAFHQRTPEDCQIFRSSCRWAECTNSQEVGPKFWYFWFPEIYLLIRYDKQIQFWLVTWVRSEANW